MRIFKLRSDVDRYRWLAARNESDESILWHLHDGPAGAAWKPIAVEWIDEDANKPKSDFPTFSTHPVFSQRAVDALLDTLIEHGEILPLHIEGESYYLYNVTTILDALDETRSEIVRFPTGRVLDITRYAFRPEIVGSATIFRLPQLRGSSFVTDAFLDRVAAAGLTGFAPPLVWKSDLG